MGHDGRIQITTHKDIMSIKSKQMNFDSVKKKR